jgi:hypothetical protein
MDTSALALFVFVAIVLLALGGLVWILWTGRKQ